MSLQQLLEWMNAEEDEHLEFKEAKSRFDFELLIKYCCAFANEGGGHLVLGVTDKRPRRVVGSQAFLDIISKQSPRNRRIAEALGRCGLVERAGQGADRMFGAAIREGKLPPDFAGTDAYEVAIALHGKVQDESFLLFLERLGLEQQVTLRIDDLLVLDAVHRDLAVAANLRHRLPGLVELGALERVGRGRGVRYLLARRFYDAVGKRGVYTRRRGLDRNTNKALLLEHITSRREEGCPLSELHEVLPALSRAQVQTLLREMKRDGMVYPVGKTRGGRWFQGPGQDGAAE